MRPLPPRGDIQATRYWVFGVGAYALFSGTLVAMLAFRDGRFHPDEYGNSSDSATIRTSR
jgi:hypothetical protein